LAIRLTGVYRAPAAFAYVLSARVVRQEPVEKVLQREVVFVIALVVVTQFH